MTQETDTTIYTTTAKRLPLRLQRKIRGLINVFHDNELRPFGKLFTATQILIVYFIAFRAYPRIILILPTQYGKSLAVAIGVLIRVATHSEKWAIIAPTEEKGRIIMDYIVEHIFDHEWLINKLDYSGSKEQLMQERSKTRLTFKGAGEVRVYTANATNSQAVKRALMGFGSPNIVLDESPLIPDDLYATVKRMLGGTKDNFLLEIGNPFYKNHFWRMWISKLYIRVWLDVWGALKEGRYTEDYIQEMKDEAMFDVLYECHFPEGDNAPPGYRALLPGPMVENSFIDNDLPLGHQENGELLDKPILGIDPNHGGSNYTVMTVRYPFTGFAKVFLRKRYEDSRNITSEIGNDALKIMEDYAIDDYRVIVDAGGVGAGLADWFEERGYFIQPVLFGQQANNSSRYANKKAELFWELRKWIMSGNGKLLKHDGFLELKEINYKETATSKLQMETKQELAKRNVASPDVADSLALTFENVSDIADDEEDII